MKRVQARLKCRNVLAVIGWQKSNIELHANIELVLLFQILLDDAEPRDAGRPSCLLQSAGGKANRILLASALSSMRIICPNMISRRE